MMHPIEKVWNDDLCTGCGTCAGICSFDAIEMVRTTNGLFKPVVDCSKCNDCNICTESCPGHSVDFVKLNEFVFDEMPEDSFLGSVANCYLGHCMDREIRWKATSGGIVTALLVFMLEEGMIDGALVTRMKKNNPLEPEPFIARTREEIIDAATSKYCPVPANIALKEILESKDDEKFAVVGLPCHIHGIRKAEMIDETLKEKIDLHIGLFCSGTISFLGTEFLLQKQGIKKEDVLKLKYRGEGPGEMSIKLKNRCEIRLRFAEYWRIFSSRFFTPTRCMLCYDDMNVFADISFSDPKLPGLKGAEIGKSIVLSRTKVGKSILQFAQLKGKIKISPTRLDKIMQFHYDELFFKKDGFTPRYNILKTLGKKMPVYTNLNTSQKKAKSSTFGWITILYYINAWFGSKYYFYKLLQFIPLKRMLAIPMQIRRLLLKL